MKLFFDHWSEASHKFSTFSLWLNCQPKSTSQNKILIWFSLKAKDQTFKIWCLISRDRNSSEILHYSPQLIPFRNQNTKLGDISRLGHVVQEARLIRLACVYSVVLFMNSAGSPRLYITLLSSYKYLPTWLSRKVESKT